MVRRPSTRFRSPLALSYAPLMRARPAAVGLFVLVGVAACTSSPSPTVTPSPSASDPIEQTGNLPPGCETIDLRSPDGERVVLDGTWVEDAEAGHLMTWWIVTVGDCVWATGSVDEPAAGGTIEARHDQVQSLSGRIGSDYVITGEILWLGGTPLGAPGNPPRYSPLLMEIDWDAEGAIFLSEDRDPAVRGPRCPDPAGFCPAPLVLRPIEP